MSNHRAAAGLRRAACPERFRRRFTTALWVVAASTGGCDGDDPAGPNDDPNAPGLHVIAGGGSTDTVDAEPAQALVIRVVNTDGAPAQGAVVRFTPTQIVPAGSNPQLTMEVSSLAGTGWLVETSGTTDADGRAAARVRMGHVAGPAAIQVSVPALGLAQTVAYTVKPGEAVQLAIAPRDTALVVGRSLSLRGGARDRYDNSRTDGVRYSASSEGASTSGSTVSARAVGRVRIVAQAGSLSDTVHVSIVPSGEIVAYAAPWSSQTKMALFTFALDGSGFRRLVESTIDAGYSGEMPGVWSIDGKTIYYHDNKRDHTRDLRAVTVATGVSRRLPTAANQMAHEAWPATSRDGQWVYYNGAASNEGRLFRIRTDGTGRESLSLAGARQLNPSLSPDGRRVASGSHFGIEVMEIATRASTIITPRGFAPAWSPSGELIAYVTATEFDRGAINVIRPDGTGERAVTTATDYYGRLDWSPDSKYLVAVKGEGRLVVIVVATGEEVPIPITAMSHGLLSPSWKP